MEPRVKSAGGWCRGGGGPWTWPVLWGLCCGPWTWPVLWSLDMACAVGPVLWSLDMACAVGPHPQLSGSPCELSCAALPPSRFSSPVHPAIAGGPPLCVTIVLRAVRDHCASCCAAITRSPPHPALGAVFTGICAQNSLWMQPPPPPALVLVKETLLFWERVRDAHCCLTLTCQRFSHVRGMPVLLLPCRLHRW